MTGSQYFCHVLPTNPSSFLPFLQCNAHSPSFPFPLPFSLSRFPCSSHRVQHLESDGFQALRHGFSKLATPGYVTEKGLSKRRLAPDLAPAVGGGWLLLRVCRRIWLGAMNAPPTSEPRWPPHRGASRLPASQSPCEACWGGASPPSPLCKSPSICPPPPTPLFLFASESGPWQLPAFRLTTGQPLKHSNLTASG